MFGQIVSRYQHVKTLLKGWYSVLFWFIFLCERQRHLFVLKVPGSVIIGQNCLVNLLDFCLDLKGTGTERTAHILVNCVENGLIQALHWFKKCFVFYNRFNILWCLLQKSRIKTFSTLIFLIRGSWVYGGCVLRGVVYLISSCFNWWDCCNYVWTSGQNWLPLIHGEQNEHDAAKDAHCVGEGSQDAHTSHTRIDVLGAEEGQAEQTG